jgi:hypothetical protein
MNATANTSWYEANQSYLAAALCELRTELEKIIPQSESQSGGDIHSNGSGLAFERSEWNFPQPPAIENICALFELSSFERKILLMCAGAEMDARFPALYATAQKDARRVQPTFSLALTSLPEPHWSAISPARPLRRWQLVEIAGGETLATSSLRIQERVLHYLAGVESMDERLQPLLRPVAQPELLAASHVTTAEQIAAAWSQASRESGLPIVQLCGNVAADKRAIAAAGAAMAGLRLHALSAWTLPHAASDIETLLRLWEREALFGSSALLLECDDDYQGDISAALISRLMESVRTPLIVSAQSPRKAAYRSAVLFDVDSPTKSEQAELWRKTLQSRYLQLNGQLEAVVSQFNFGAAAMQSAVWQAGIDLPPDSAEENGQGEREAAAKQLWNACRVQARPRLEGLAQRIKPAAAWDDLVLDENQKRMLNHIAVHVRQRSMVYQSWGFASKGSRGLGISALFAGPSGTGKTMAAEILANELRLDLYRIDLSQVVSKYIGETEKNLRRVFDAADEGAAVLLFDEADALFGKRSDVKDSHDRYANIEISYLLQRMESYRGLAILTTNRRNALDQAFLRRIRFVVEFPFPEVAQRAEIWRRVFPESTPTDGLKVERLARLHAAGGHIRNIAMGAAFLAADAGEPVRMSHLLVSARSEFAKLEKPLPDAEVAGWV